ncbi:MAG: SDR family NAD(P)-dependent oxidoreductase, partial [Cyclobacteriaceae bacterium]
LLDSVADLHVRGAAIDWKGVAAGTDSKRISLPTYPWQKESYWIRYNGPSVAKTPADSSSLLSLLASGKRELVEEKLNGSGILSKSQQALIPELLDILTKATKADLTAQNALPAYQVKWTAVADGSSASEIHTEDQYLIFVHSERIAEAVCQVLTTKNLVFAFPSESFSQTSEHSFTIRPGEKEDLEHLLQAYGSEGPLSILYLWGFEDSEEDISSEEYCEAVEKFGLGLLHLVQVLSSRENANLWVGTSRSIAVNDQPVTYPAGAILWGMAKSIAIEYPSFFKGIADVSGISLDDSIRHFIHHTTSPVSSEKELGYHEGRWYAPRLMASDNSVKTEWSPAADKTILITGGLGNIGLHTAKMLAGEGVKYLALLSRSGKINDLAREVLEELKNQGVEVSVLKADVSEKSSLQAALDNMSTPIGGIVHAAGIMAYEPIESMSSDAFIHVIKAKVNGLINLHALTLTQPLDFFVCYSSIAAVWGSKGQAHYAAANAFMDSFCYYRRKEGLPASSINWGLWHNADMATEQRLLAQAGIQTIYPSEGVAALKWVISGKSSQLTLAKVDWDKLVPLFRVVTGGRLFSELVSENTTDPQPVAESAFLSELSSMPETARKDRLVYHIKEVIASILLLSNGRLPSSDESFFEMGFDSLMALELKDTLEKQLQVTLPPTIGFDFPTIDTLATHLYYDILGYDREPAGADNGEEESSEFDGLSMEEIRELLEKEIDKN